MRRFLPVLLIVPAFGFQCEYFDDVVVPQNDTTPPVLANRVWIDGEEQVRLGSFYDVVNDPTTSIAVFPAVIDSGGAQYLGVEQLVTVRCHDADADPEVGQIVYVHFNPKSTTQEGTVGSTVSNGLFLAGDVSDFADYDGYCEPGFELTKVTYSWGIVGRDFAGNEAALSGNSIVYQP